MNVTAAEPRLGEAQHPASFVLQALVVLSVVVFLAVHLVRDPGPFLNWVLLIWIVVVAVIDLMPVPAWGQMQLTLSFPILLAVGMIYSPAVAGMVALVGSFDPREIKRTISLTKAAFVRSQVAVSVVTASLVFHALADLSSPWYVVLPVAILALASDYTVNVLLVSSYTALTSRRPFLRSVADLHLGRRWEFLSSYFLLGMFGVVIAYLHHHVGLWAMPIFLAPLVFARQMFYRTRTLEETMEQLKQREQTLKSMATELRRVSDAKSDFLARLSHDLKAPIAAIQIAAQMLEDPSFGVTADRQVHGVGGKISTSSQHLLRLIDDLLDLSRIEAGVLRLQLRPTSLNSILVDAERSASLLALRKGVTMRFPQVPDQTVVCDRLRIQQVLLNLLANGVQFTPRGGEVWVEVASRADTVAISVCDTGVGISSEDLPRIFEPFERASSRGESGLGLGLAISRHIVQLHQGRLEATSRLGAGSTFTLTLAKAERDSHSPELRVPTQT